MSAYIEFLKSCSVEKAEKSLILSRQRKREILGEIAEDRDAKHGERVMAIKTDNQMTGDDAPVRIEGEITLNAIFQALTTTTGIPDAIEAEIIEDDPLQLT